MEIEFDIDAALLADNPVIDSSLGIAFYTPVGWVESEMPDLSDETMPGQFLIPKHFYINPADSSSMLIATLQNLSNEQLAIMRVKYYEIFNSQAIWYELQHDAFTFNKLNADQFIMFNDELINFKFIITNAQPFAWDYRISLDYFLPRENYEKNIKSVESSIGSLLLLN